MAFHARSISFPSRVHPITHSVEDQLNRLRTLEATSSSSPSMICEKLDGLKNLYECVDCMLQLPLTRQALSHESDKKCLGDLLDGTLGLLDLCGTTKDVSSQMKACVQDLESSIRRNNCRESTYEIEKYFISRKKVNKVVLKCSANLKRTRKCNLEIVEKDCEFAAIIGILRKVEAVSLTVFESLLTFVCPMKARSKSVGQSLVSKFIQSKRVSTERVDEDDEIKVEKMDAALDGLNKHKSSKGIEVMKVQNAQKGLKVLESTMQELEEGLECVFRCLIKSRVSLLNILNH